MIDRILSELNSFSGSFLLVIAFGISSCAKALHTIKDEITCLHEDFETVHHAHEMQEHQARAKYGV